MSKEDLDGDKVLDVADAGLVRPKVPAPVSPDIDGVQGQIVGTVEAVLALPQITHTDRSVLSNFRQLGDLDGCNPSKWWLAKFLEDYLIDQEILQLCAMSGDFQPVINATYTLLQRSGRCLPPNTPHKLLVDFLIKAKVLPQNTACNEIPEPIDFLSLEIYSRANGLLTYVHERWGEEKWGKGKSAIKVPDFRAKLAVALKAPLQESGPTSVQIAAVLMNVLSQDCVDIQKCQNHKQALQKAVSALVNGTYLLSDDPVKFLMLLGVYPVPSTVPLHEQALRQHVGREVYDYVVAYSDFRKKIADACGGKLIPGQISNILHGQFSSPEACEYDASFATILHHVTTWLRKAGVSNPSQFLKDAGVDLSMSNKFD